MSKNNYKILWFQDNLNRTAMNRAADAIQQTGKALPCTVTAVNGSLVTVKFEVTFTTYSADYTKKQTNNTLPPITIPKAESQWLRSPTQVGDVGLTVPADTFIGGISGQGSGVANLDIDYGNLTTLVWVPVAALSFPTTPNPNGPWLNGPAGATISDTEQTVVSIYDHAGKAISHIVPTSGGVLGLGALASTLTSTRAVPAKADLQTLSNNLLGTSIQSLMSIMSAAMVSAGIPNAAAFQTIVTASGWINSNITFPTIPNCSSIVRVST